MLEKAANRYSYPGRLYDYMNPQSLVERTRTFYGRCLGESHDVVVWFTDYVGDDSKWHSSYSVARLSHAGEKLSKLTPQEATLSSVLSAAKKGACTELPGIDGSTEP
jgi:hypothetical protein